MTIYEPLIVFSFEFLYIPSTHSYFSQEIFFKEHSQMIQEWKQK